MKSFGCFAVVASLFIGASSTARADWPMARHDGARRAAAQGKSDIQKPEVAWRAFLGGSILAIRTADVDGDGQSELIRVDGSSIAAVRPDGTEVWKQRVLGGTSILAIADLDGDGHQELVTFTSLGASVLDLATGKTLWEQPPHEMGKIHKVRMRDMDGDGRPELVIGECRGCGGDKPQSGFIYSFATGFSTPKRVTITYPDLAVTQVSTMIDAFGKGAAQLLAEGPGGHLILVDGATSAALATSPDLGFTGGGYVPGCVAADVDGAPGEEAICFYTLGGEPTPGPGDPSRVFALKAKPGPVATFDVLWSRSFAPTESIISDGYALALDLDGDGATETLVTGRNAAGAHAIHILSSSTGQEVASVPGAVLAGVTQTIAGAGRLFVASMDGGGLVLYRYAAGSATVVGPLEGNNVAAALDEPRYAVTSANPFLVLAMDVDGNGRSEVFTTVTATGELRAATVTNTQVTPFAAAQFTADRPLTGVWPFPPMDRPYPQLGFWLADGTLHYFDKALQPTQSSVRVGGYYLPGGFRQLGRTQIVASLDGGPAQQILVSDSRQVLLRLDAAAATPDMPPKTEWEQRASFSPVVAPSKSGPPALFVLHLVDPHVSSASTVRRLNANGTVAWEVPVDGSAPADILTGDFDGDGVPDVLLQSGVVNAATLGTVALSGVDGHIIWSNEFTGCMLPGGPSIADWNGDGVGDVIQQSAGTQVFSGVDGSVMATGGPSLCYALPVLVDANGDGADEVVLTADSGGAQLYTHDLANPIFAGPDDDQAFPYGAVAKCPGGPVLVAGSWSYPTRLKLTPLGGPSTGNGKAVFLSGGALYQDQASADAHGTSQLTAANVHENLTGSGLPTVVVGSGDGFLYAVDPCGGALLFSYDFGAAVGEPVFGDTDGDGLDEIVVSVADGYLYALKNTPPVGTGGAGGTGGVGGQGTGGQAVGGQGTGGHGGGGDYELTGRAGMGCVCGLGAGAPVSGGSLAFAAALLASVARRRARRASRLPSGE